MSVERERRRFFRRGSPLPVTFDTLLRVGPPPSRQAAFRLHHLGLLLETLVNRRFCTRIAASRGVWPGLATPTRMRRPRHAATAAAAAAVTLLAVLPTLATAQPGSKDWVDR